MGLGSGMICHHIEISTKTPLRLKVYGRNDDLVLSIIVMKSEFRRIMKMNRFILLTLLLTLSSSIAYGRKPAVEDFVGVESEDYKKTPEGTEVLFNFGNEIQKVNSQTPQNKLVSSNSNQSSWFGLVSLAIFIAFPIFMWLGITRFTNRSSQDSNEESSIITPDAAITDLNQYRSQKDHDEKQEDQDKKAS